MAEQTIDGSGSGFSVYVFAEIAGETSYVSSADRLKKLREQDEASMREPTSGIALPASQRGHFRLGDRRKG
ncbi:hypothetical protein O1611_g3904 [Lasiodiplodia mahajangana]|uniref:Uncharacterized protein n=1 Tax=Lasiodiplodia mahajangana TaxID=1108764 RepID=A0ACC2JQG4_9PEZI|nr:hypothetical protein O1611_g3904 [Lasiodiplodia mahajangana]